MPSSARSAFSEDSKDSKDSGVVLVPCSRACTRFPCQLCVLPDLLHGEVMCLAVHSDVMVHALVEVVREKGLESLILLQAWDVTSLEVRGSQMPILLPWRFMIPLHDREGAESGRGLVGVQQVLL